MYYTSSNNSICTVKNGVIYGVGEGICTITVHSLDGVTKSFDVTVANETPDIVETININIDDYDFSTAESTTLSFISIFCNYTDGKMRKIVIPKGTYYISPVYGTIKVPTHTIVDFSNSIIQILESTMTQSGYKMFLFSDNISFSSIENVTINGERYLISGTGAESCISVSFSGGSYKCGLKNCNINNSVGFNIMTEYRAKWNYPITLSGITYGSIDNNGNEINESYTYRSNYTNVLTLESPFGIGNMQGYQGYSYLSARIIDVYFYDENKNYISCIKDCVQYYCEYTKPNNAVYARVVFKYNSAPTSCDPDFGSIAHFYHLKYPDRCYIESCYFKNNYSTAIAPEGGYNLFINNCTFKNNGYRDPSSHIDWEDGRLHNKGHIVKDCYFEGGGQVVATGADGLTMFDNVFKNTRFSIGNEVQNQRLWLNQFLNTRISLYTKTDWVYSQNQEYDCITDKTIENGNCKMRSAIIN